ncbi:MAG: DEAD/DEAH box helicase family protein, partial [Spirochaetes bacterium]|nr:DEAD/DEAH box helicase family protein [Spirochaetota bacterium]
MSFRQAVPGPTIDTSSHDIVQDFFVPMLQNATRYDRGVGYFSSGWLRANAQGMIDFAANEGRARWITSPMLSEGDWEALQAGEKARTDELLREVLSHKIESLRQALEQDTLSALAWMVADNILDFRLAVPHTKLDQGNFHIKFGVFTDDDGDQVSFSGSYNDSEQGLRNYEGLNIFRSWDGTASYVQQSVEQFERLWSGDDPNLRIYDLPAAARDEILQLRSNERPYPEPSNPHVYSAGGATGRVEEGSAIDLWDHQKEALKAWRANGHVGLLNMATGSGKTVTALMAAERSPEMQLLVIAVPTKNLVEQWDEELRSVTSLPDPILVYESSARWQDRLFRKLRVGHRNDWTQPLTVVGSLDSLSGARFQSVIEDAGIPEHAMLIVDEVHNVGAPTYRKILNPAYSLRLGLSATPERSHDEEGSEAIMEYFDKEVYVYSMKQALDDERLTPYDYHIYAAPLTDDEYEEYLKLTRAILANRSDVSQGTTFFTNNKLDGDSGSVEQLLFKRARILKKAEAKTDVLSTVLDEHPIERGLVYCADREQLSNVQTVLNEAGLIHLKYVGDTPTEKRRAALQSLERGDVPVIAA